MPRLQFVRVFKTVLRPQQLLMKDNVFKKGAGVQNHLLLLPCFQPFPGKGLRQKEKLKERANGYAKNRLL